jgi:hypothetical protein
MPCFTDAQTDTYCGGDNDPPNQVCGDTTNSNIAGMCVECNTDADCLSINDAGVLECDTASGTCM